MHAHAAEIVKPNGCQYQRILPEAAGINDSADLFSKTESLTEVVLNYDEETVSWVKSIT